jgi:hypothetical protein
MADATITQEPAEGEAQFQEETLSERFMDWVRTELVWYAGSFTIHLLGLSLLLLLTFSKNEDLGDAVVFKPAVPDEVEKKEPEKFEKFDLGKIEETPPPQLDVDPTLEKLKVDAQDEKNFDNNPIFSDRGGGKQGGAADAPGAGAGSLAFGGGPKISGPQGIGVGPGEGQTPGKGSNGSGFAGRGTGRRQQQLAAAGGTKHTERAVTAALIWLANHQNYTDGSWSLERYTANCKDKTCTGQGNVNADAGATALGLLPFLAAGQTHKSKGPYKEHITKAIGWLLRNQQPDGNLAKGAHQMMYSHGLATIALCEAFGLSGDPQVKQGAQRAVDFIIAAQNKEDGGWRYIPGEHGDTSVVGWQLMALKSAHMAGLSFSGDVFKQTSKWLDSVAVHDGTEYSYQAGVEPLPTMTSVGLLCRQYLGAKRDNPMLVGGVDYLMKHLPEEHEKNVYYWYYATQVLRNMNNYDWDTWNRTMRKLLVDTQVRDKNICAFGSWDPTNDQWGHHGGRVMQTALSCLTLEIYYRYLPLFKAEVGGGDVAAPAAAAAAAKAPKQPKKADAPKQPKKTVEGK